MGGKTAERGLFELYRLDADEAGHLLFGRETYTDRRGFLRGAGLAAMGALVGAAIPFHRNVAGPLPAGRPRRGGRHPGEGRPDRA